MDKEQYKKSVGATFDDVSSRYDENRFFAISAKKMVQLLPPRQPMNVLDLSTGTGVVALEVAAKHKNACIEAVDLSQGMLNRARSKAQERGCKNISFKLSDVDDLSYENESFDVVTCGYGLFFYPDMEQTFKKICEIVKPGGTFIFSSFTKDAFNPCSELFLSHLEKNYNIEIPSGLKERLTNKQQIEELAKAGNIKSVNVECYPIRYSITTDDWWALLNNAGYKSFLDQLDPQQLLQFKDEHLQEIEELSIDGIIELNADTLFGMVTI